MGVFTNLIDNIYDFDQGYSLAEDAKLRREDAKLTSDARRMEVEQRRESAQQQKALEADLKEYVRKQAGGDSVDPQQQAPKNVIEQAAGTIESGGALQTQSGAVTLAQKIAQSIKGISAPTKPTVQAGPGAGGMFPGAGVAAAAEGQRPRSSMDRAAPSAPSFATPPFVAESQQPAQPFQALDMPPVDQAGQIAPQPAAEPPPRFMKFMPPNDKNLLMKMQVAAAGNPRIKAQYDGLLAQNTEAKKMYDEERAKFVENYASEGMLAEGLLKDPANRAEALELAGQSYNRFVRETGGEGLKGLPGKPVFAGLDPAGNALITAGQRTISIKPEQFMRLYNSAAGIDYAQKIDKQQYDRSREAGQDSRAERQLSIQERNDLREQQRFPLTLENDQLRNDTSREALADAPTVRQQREAQTKLTKAQAGKAELEFNEQNTPDPIGSIRSKVEGSPEIKLYADLVKEKMKNNPDSYSPEMAVAELQGKREQMVADQIGKRFSSILKSKTKSPEEFAAVYGRLEDQVGPEAAQQLLIKFKITPPAVGAGPSQAPGTNGPAFPPGMPTPIGRAPAVGSRLPSPLVR